MVIKYNVEIKNEAIKNNIDRITNQIFKLLPCREEGGDWQAPLQNLSFEVAGMNHLFMNQTQLFSLLCKMEALQLLDREEDFFTFRKIIFECLGLCNELKKCLD